MALSCGGKELWEAPRCSEVLAALHLERQQYDLAWQHAQQAVQLGVPVQPLIEALRRVREPAR